ncbi:MAG: capsule assembly Wzi family protein [Siphonobacter sp.]
MRSAAYAQLFNRPVYDTTTTQGIRYKAELSGIASTSSRTPFWLRSNQFGTVPLESPAGLLTLGATGLWGNATQSRRPYFKASLEAVGNVTRHSRLVLPEAYAAIRLGHGELYIGRRKEINGITDTLLTSGSYAWSGNAVPITQIRLGTKDYAPLKFTKGILSVNAFFSHGWFSNTDSMQNVYLHAKALYVRIGKPNWKLRFYGGMAHYAQWGGYSKYLGNDKSDNGQLPNGWDAYLKALWPSKIEGNTNGTFTTFDTLNRSGNHLGSIDLALEIQFKKSQLFFYVQRPWEDMSGVVFGNFPDGLYGIRWKDQSHELNRTFRIAQITAEFMTTMNQSGSTYPKGNDDYFHNYQYIDGWTHQRRVIGTPFITRWMDASPRWYNLRGPFKNFSMISNNRVQLLHLAAVGSFPSGIRLRALASQSWNFGRPYSSAPLPGGAKQFSGLIEVIIPQGKWGGIEWKATVALDKGEWLTSSLAGMLSIRKSGWL